MNTDDLNNTIKEIVADVSDGRKISPDAILSALIEIRELIAELQEINK